MPVPKMLILVLRMLVLSNHVTGKCWYQEISLREISVLNMPVLVLENTDTKNSSIACWKTAVLNAAIKK